MCLGVAGTFRIATHLKGRTNVPELVTILLYAISGHVCVNIRFSDCQGRLYTNMNIYSKRERES